VDGASGAERQPRHPLTTPPRGAKQVRTARPAGALLLAKARVQDLALKGYERAAPAGHESQLAYGSPVFAAGGIPISHRCQSLPDNPYATGDLEASDAR
jgi:hypothetical protein